MKIFKENHDKCKKVPTFPTGDGDVEAVKDSFETIQAFVRSIFHLPLYISSSYSQSSFASPPFLGLGHTFGIMLWENMALLSYFPSKPASILQKKAAMPEAEGFSGMICNT